MEQTFSGISFRNFGCTSRGWPKIPEDRNNRKIPFHSTIPARAQFLRARKSRKIERYRALKVVADSVYSQPRSRVNSISRNEMNIQISLCNVRRVNGMLEISLEIVPKDTLTEKKKKIKILGKQLLFLKYSILQCKEKFIALYRQ